MVGSIHGMISPGEIKKTDGYSEVCTNGDNDDDKTGCGNLLDSREKRELEI